MQHCRMADDEAGDTDKVFPPFPESRERVISIGPSIRQEFLAHRRHIDAELSSFRLELQSALERLSPDVTPASAARRVASGARQAAKMGGIVLAILGALTVALKARHPELAGPLGDLLKLFE